MLIFPKLSPVKHEQIGFVIQWNAFYSSIAEGSKSINLKGNIVITVLLITLNILIFIMMVFAGLGVMSFDSRDLYKWGADNSSAVVEGQYWRLLTSMFLHGG